MRNTKLRNQIYKKAYNDYDLFNKQVGAKVLGACEAIQMGMGGKFYECGEAVTESSFPELYMFKDHDNLMWLDGPDGAFENTKYGAFENTKYRINIRKTVLLFCIEMTK